MSGVYIAGVSMTPFGNHERSSVAELATTAVREAAADAGIELADIDAAFFGNTTQAALEGQLMIGGQVVLRGMGFARIPMFNVENACATGASALHLAINHVRAGAADVVLAVGAEKMNVGDRAKSMAVFDGAYDVSRPEALEEFLQERGLKADDAGARSIFMDIYAAWALSHMERYGTTQDRKSTRLNSSH